MTNNPFREEEEKWAPLEIYTGETQALDSVSIEMESGSDGVDTEAVEQERKDVSSKGNGGLLGGIGNAISNIFNPGSKDRNPLFNGIEDTGRAALENWVAPIDQAIKDFQAANKALSEEMTGISSAQHEKNLELAAATESVQQSVIALRGSDDPALTVDMAQNNAIEALAQAQSLSQQTLELQEEWNSAAESRFDAIAELQSATSQSIPRIFIIPRNSATISDGENYIQWDRSNRRINFLGSWVGHAVFYASSSASNGEVSTILHLDVPSGINRYWSVSSAFVTGMLFFYVYPAVQRDLQKTWDVPYLSGDTAVRGSGSVSTIGTAFTVPKNSGQMGILVTLKLRNADRGTSYGVQVDLNGETFTRTWKNVGPFTNLESGARTVTAVFEVDTPKSREGGTLVVKTSNNADRDSQIEMQTNGIMVKVTYREPQEDSSAV